jgi:hypothetical protein
MFVQNGARVPFLFSSLSAEPRSPDSAASCSHFYVFFGAPARERECIYDIGSALGGLRKSFCFPLVPTCGQSWFPPSDLAFDASHIEVLISSLAAAVDSVPERTWFMLSWTFTLMKTLAKDIELLQTRSRAYHESPNECHCRQLTHLAHLLWRTTCGRCV